MTSTIRNHPKLNWFAAGALAAVLACLLLLGGPTGGAKAGTQKCGNASATLQTATKKQVRDGVECLIAKARQHFDRHKVSDNVQVRGVSKRHAHTMVKTNCFRHVCDGEGSIPTRLKRSGYLDGAKTYGYGENTGCAGTPKAMVKAWLKSGYHRGNLLGSKYRDIGIGVAKGAPAVQTGCQTKGFMTFSVLFTWRKG